MMLIWPILFLLVAVFAWYLLAKPGAPLAGEDSPELLLKRRYAKGEIDREEYERRLDDLRK
ncbi:MAG TPA: SHOCT domain-containing protein [Vicinamibacterales bacterium]|nr:SHOCT domain-containing protein [Vicinamibacterales bacterium]